MRNRVLILAPFAILVGCASSLQGGAETAGSGPSYSDLENRFEALEDGTAEFDGAAISELPEVAEEDDFYVLESVVGAPAMDQSRDVYVILPPREWVIGTNSDGEDIRMAFLEPDGGSMTLTYDGVLETPDEVTVTWIVRYERQNVLLTEAGTALSVHVTPIAARVEIPDERPLYWISGEAPTQSSAEESVE